MWNLKNRINEQIKLGQTHRHREQAGGCQGGRVGGLGERGERIKKYRLAVTK